jgi:hypothetical protein
VRADLISVGASVPVGLARRALYVASDPDVSDAEAAQLLARLPSDASCRSNLRSPTSVAVQSVRRARGVNARACVLLHQAIAELSEPVFDVAS